MKTILGFLLLPIFLRDRKKKIAQFLRTATPDSVLSDLHTCLVREGVSSITPQDVFNASSIRDSLQEEPYWTIKSFHNHLARTHPDTTIPDAAIDVLWSCFCFYANLPFSFPGAGDRKLEFPAFERGLILLSLQGTRLLGTIVDDFGPCWKRNEGPCSCRSRINRIFRSISLVNRQSSSDPRVARFDTFVTDDVIDAILLIFPAHPLLNPSFEQLIPLAERFLERRPDQYHMKVNDLAALLCLMMRLSLYKPTWGRDSHYGLFEESSPEKEELANILARSFCLTQGEYLDPDSVLRALDILPNLEQCFHQLWATLFQPLTSTGIPNVEPESSPDTTIDGILRAVSFFIPPFQAHKRTELARNIELIRFQKCYDSISHSLTNSLDLGHILQQTFHDDPSRRSHLVLFLGDQAQESEKVVVGAFFSRCTEAPAAKEEKQPERIANPRNTPPQLLFQLQPSFSLFQWTGEDSMSSSQAYNSATGHTDYPNGIGDLNRSKVGVEIESVTRQATFLRGTATSANRMSGGYEEVTRKCDGAGTIDGDQQEPKTIFTVTRIAIFNVEGGPNYDYPW
ncbi:hypothetical protein AARAC_006328 [Aspergillus arachidicola]|uniref:TLDc domain-containing protein n=1 Tax=Aspergillus arachidicola TaxID=656916 RepID=A0A2G7FTR4_9EURO|nr:hypothetical protein AARAC_006328 [Aspergillus arachidicola]